MPKSVPLTNTSAPLEVESTEVRPPTRRRTFSTKEKLRILRAAEQCTARGELGALLRREGIYHSMLGKWRDQLAEHGEAGLKKTRGRKAAKTPELKEIERLQKAAEQDRKEIGRLHELLELQKKVLALVDAAQNLVR